MPRTIRNTAAARLFPNAAAANRSIFFDRSGRARSVSEVYSVLNSRYAGAANSQATRTAMAAVGGHSDTSDVRSAVPATQPTDNAAAYLSALPEGRSRHAGHDGIRLERD